MRFSLDPFKWIKNKDILVLHYKGPMGLIPSKEWALRLTMHQNEWTVKQLNLWDVNENVRIIEWTPNLKGRLGLPRS